MAARLADFVFNAGALRFGDFPLRSGRASPYYFDVTRFNCGEAMALMGEAMADLLVKNRVQFDTVFGPSYKGIPLATATASAMFTKYHAKPGFIYDRKEERGKDGETLLVGPVSRGQRVVIVDDICTTGLSKYEAIKEMQNAGLIVVAVVVLLDRQEKDVNGVSVAENLRKLGIPLYAVLNSTDLIEYLAIQKKIPAGHYARFTAYFKQYGAKMMK